VADVRDISGRRRGEGALRNSERRFRSLFENSRDAVLLTNTDGSIDTANAAAWSLTRVD
jgi:PAS domain-containing protein